MLLSFVKVSTYIFNHAFLDLLFGRKKTCHHYECAECTKNYHCYGNQYCSGYSCLARTTPRPVTYYAKSNSNPSSFSFPTLPNIPISLPKLPTIRFV